MGMHGWEVQHALGEDVERLQAELTRMKEDRDHFLSALAMIEDLSADPWAREVATTALRIARETLPAKG